MALIAKHKYFFCFICLVSGVRCAVRAVGGGWVMFGTIDKLWDEFNVNDTMKHVRQSTPAVGNGGGIARGVLASKQNDINVDTFDTIWRYLFAILPPVWTTVWLCWLVDLVWRVGLFEPKAQYLGRILNCSWQHGNEEFDYALDKHVTVSGPGIGALTIQYMEGGELIEPMCPQVGREDAFQFCDEP